jgi:hypothetical protein
MRIHTRLRLDSSRRTPFIALAMFAIVAFGCQATAQQPAASGAPGAGLHIVPDHIGDPHFTSGPCPLIAPPDGAACPNGAAKCPAFYNPAILPAGYNSVSYCSGFLAPGVTMLTKPLNVPEQEAFLKAAKKAESYVIDNQTGVMEPYKVDFLDSKGNNTLFYYGNEYWNPVCAADALLPPFSNQAPVIVENPDGSYSYSNLPETYTTVLNALKKKNAANRSPMKLIDYLPSHDQINVEWPPTFFAWQDSTDVASDLASNFLVGTSNNYPVTPNAKPFTLCAAPAAMKMLGFASLFNKNGHTIDDINSPAYNVNVTLKGTDGALVIPDSPGLWMYDSTSPAVVSTQLPKAYFENSLNSFLPYSSCADPTQCQFPVGANPGIDLIAVFSHEVNHMLGIMSSQYYKVQYEGTSLAYTFGTALFPLDLFDLDSDYVVPGYGHKGIQTYADFTSAPRNNNTYEPNTVVEANAAADLTPFVQFGRHDHVVVHSLDKGEPQYFPLMNYSVFNPDGDIQYQQGLVDDFTKNTQTMVIVDPLLVNLDPLDVVPFNVQASGPGATIEVNTIREYSELAAEGWNINDSTLKDPYHTISPVARWYETCFDANGVFTTSKNSKCKFSVLPNDLKFLGPQRP